MNENKQIEEMAQDIYNALPDYEHNARDCRDAAEEMVAKGYCKQEWISVKERLPDNHRMVLVVCESTSISAGALIAIGSYGGGFWSLGGADGTLYLTKYMQFVVSHWMELPEMPKGEENG